MDDDHAAHSIRDHGRHHGPFQEASWDDDSEDDVHDNGGAPRSSQLARYHLVQVWDAEMAVAVAVAVAEAATIPMEVHRTSSLVMMASFQV